MMKRYFSHYTIIYPSIFRKNHVTELDEENRLIRYYPYENEVSNTEFYSGLLVFAPSELDLDFSFIRKCWSSREMDRLEAFFSTNNEKASFSLKENALNMYHIP